MADFFVDGGFQPETPILCGRQAPRTVRAGDGVVIPGRVGDQRPALTQSIWQDGGNEIDLVDGAPYRRARADMQDERSLQL